MSGITEAQQHAAEWIRAALAGPERGAGCGAHYEDYKADCALGTPYRRPLTGAQFAAIYHTIREALAHRAR